MYIVGHCVITDLSKPGPFDLYGSDSIALMLPDIVRCHDWGYERCLRERSSSIAGQLIRMHMLADWFIHFGDGVVRERVGWAYRKMSVYAREYDAFFHSAATRNLRRGEPTDSRRGFSHTMIEYSIDTWLVRNGYFDGRFDSVRDALGRVGGEQGAGSLSWIRETMDAEGIESDSLDLSADATSFADRVMRSNDAHEFVYRAGVKKFGLKDCDDSISLMAETIEKGLRKIPGEEMRGIVDQAARFLTYWRK